jgi:hypothetical protein
MTVAEIIVVYNPSITVNARINSLIELAELETGDIFGALRNKAVALLVLHWYSLDARGAAAASGNITQESEGDLSRSYGRITGTGDDELNSSVWGSQLKRLRNSCIFSARNRVI